MDTKLQSFLDKVKDTASRTGRSVGRAADAAGKKASEMAAATRLNLRIFDLNTECDVLFRVHAFGQHLPELRQDLQPRGLLLSRLRHGAIIV